jgi:hypothetical protein
VEAVAQDVEEGHTEYLHRHLAMFPGEGSAVVWSLNSRLTLTSTTLRGAVSAVKEFD